jgi:hypothetical protein
MNTGRTLKIEANVDRHVYPIDESPSLPQQRLYNSANNIDKPLTVTEQNKRAGTGENLKLHAFPWTQKRNSSIRHRNYRT